MSQVEKPDRREKLQQKMAELQAQLRDLDARDRQVERKRDTRRKIIAGALALEHAAVNPDSEFAIQMTKLLNRYVTKPHERKLFDLPERAANETPSPDFRQAANGPA